MRLSIFISLKSCLNIFSSSHIESLTFVFSLSFSLADRLKGGRRPSFGLQIWPYVGQSATPKTNKGTEEFGVADEFPDGKALGYPCIPNVTMATPATALECRGERPWSGPSVLLTKKGAYGRMQCLTELVPIPECGVKTA